MREQSEETVYNRALYAKSARHRLARINHSRRRRGSAPYASLAEANLRIPLDGR